MNLNVVGKKCYVDDIRFINNCEMFSLFIHLWQMSLRKYVRIRSYSGPYFSAFGLNAERYAVSLRIQSKYGKIWIRITPNTDTFYTICCLLFLFDLELRSIVMWNVLRYKYFILFHLMLFVIELTVYCDLISDLPGSSWK